MSVKDPYKARKREPPSENPEKIENDELTRDMPKTAKIRVNKSKTEEKE